MKRTKHLISKLAVVSILIISQACSNSPQMASNTGNNEINKAICVLQPTDGNTAQGVITFTRTDDGIEIEADVEGLTAGKHGFHIHQYGDLTTNDGTSAGGHFNPDNEKHSAPTNSQRHVGDLGNLNAGDDGRAHYQRVDKDIAFEGKHSIIGRAIVVHAGEDDLKSQPTGDAGSRVAYGIIGIAK